MIRPAQSYRNHFLIVLSPAQSYPNIFFILLSPVQRDDMIHAVISKSFLHPTLACAATWYDPCSHIKIISLSCSRLCSEMIWSMQSYPNHVFILLSPEQRDDMIGAVISKSCLYPTLACAARWYDPCSHIKIMSLSYSRLCSEMIWPVQSYQNHVFILLSPVQRDDMIGAVISKSCLYPTLACAARWYDPCSHIEIMSLSYSRLCSEMIWPVQSYQNHFFILLSPVQRDDMIGAVISKSCLYPTLACAARWYDRCSHIKIIYLSYSRLCSGDDMIHAVISKSCLYPTLVCAARWYDLCSHIKIISLPCSRLRSPIEIIYLSYSRLCSEMIWPVQSYQNHFFILLSPVQRDDMIGAVISKSCLYPTLVCAARWYDPCSHIEIISLSYSRLCSEMIWSVQSYQNHVFILLSPVQRDDMIHAVISKSFIYPTLACAARWYDPCSHIEIMSLSYSRLCSEMIWSMQSYRNHFFILLSPVQRDDMIGAVISKSCLYPTLACAARWYDPCSHIEIMSLSYSRLCSEMIWSVQSYQKSCLYPTLACAARWYDPCSHIEIMSLSYSRLCSEMICPVQSYQNHFLTVLSPAQSYRNHLFILLSPVQRDDMTRAVISKSFLYSYSRLCSEMIWSVQSYQNHVFILLSPVQRDDMIGAVISKSCLYPTLACAARWYDRCSHIKIMSLSYSRLCSEMIWSMQSYRNHVFILLSPVQRDDMIHAVISKSFPYRALACAARWYDPCSHIKIISLSYSRLCSEMIWSVQSYQNHVFILLSPVQRDDMIHAVISKSFPYRALACAVLSKYFLYPTLACAARWYDLCSHIEIISSSYSRLWSEMIWPVQSYQNHFFILLSRVKRDDMTCAVVSKCIWVWLSSVQWVEMTCGVVWKFFTNLCRV